MSLVIRPNKRFQRYPRRGRREGAILTMPATLNNPRANRPSSNPRTPLQPAQETAVEPTIPCDEIREYIMGDAKGMSVRALRELQNTFDPAGFGLDEALDSFGDAHARMWSLQWAINEYTDSREPVPSRLVSAFEDANAAYTFASAYVHFVVQAQVSRAAVHAFKDAGVVPTVPIARPEQWTPAPKAYRSHGKPKTEA